MPFDLTPTTFTKADLWNPAAFIAWLRTKPADDRYEYSDRYTCACGQFFTARGGRGDRPFWDDPGYVVTSTERDAERIACAAPRTFGALLERAIAKWPEAA